MDKRSLIFRPSKEAPCDLPFGLRSCGHYQVGKAWRDGIRQKDFLQLFWGIRGEGIFQLAGRTFKLRAGELFVYLPGDIHCVSAETDFEYRWLTMDGPLILDIFKAFCIEQTPRFVGACPEDLFVQLEAAIKDNTRSGQLKSAAMAYRILSLAASSPAQLDAHEQMLSEALEIIGKSFRDHSFNVNSLAEKLHVNRSSLSRLFSRRHGVSVIEYINSCRIQHVLSMLKQTSFALDEIACESGFNDTAYMIRVVKQKTGMTPGVFRRLN